MTFRQSWLVSLSSLKMSSSRSRQIIASLTSEELKFTSLWATTLRNLLAVQPRATGESDIEYCETVGRAWPCKGKCKRSPGCFACEPHE